VLAVDGYGGMRLAVWEKDDPSQAKQLVESADASWANREWSFLAQVFSGVMDVDWYRELDDGGIGQRTGISDISGSTSWRYDAGERPNLEQKSITGGGTYTTRWGYNAGGQLAWMQYPGASQETVTYSYHPQMALNGVTGSSTYVQNTRYDAAGRMTQIVRGPGLLTSSYSYYGWQEDFPVQGENVFQGARLKQMTTIGNPLNPNLQDLSYLYDEAGNVLRILDAKNSNQKQCFKYDDLDRLTQATTNGNADLGCTADLDNGNYPQDYSYRDFDGSLLSKSGMGTYYYNDDDHKHAVTHLGETQKYCYRWNRRSRSLEESSENRL
jgi:YD repeat-containing protein